MPFGKHKRSRHLTGPKKRRGENKGATNDTKKQRTKPNVSSAISLSLKTTKQQQQQQRATTPTTDSASSYGLRSSTLLVQHTTNNVRSILPPFNKDDDFMNGVDGPKIHTHTVVCESAPPVSGNTTHAEKTQDDLRIDHALEIFKTAPMLIQNLIRKSTVVRVPLPRMFLFDSFFHKKSTSNKFGRAALTDNGSVDIDMSRILDTTLPTGTIGRGKGYTYEEVVVGATLFDAVYKGRPIFNYPSVKNGVTPQLRYDTIESCPFYIVKGKDIRLIRVGDYLTPRMVINALSICHDNFYNLAVILLIACHNRYHWLLQKHKHSTSNNKADVKGSNQIDIDLTQYLLAVNKLGLDIGRAISGVSSGNKHDELRHGWRHWNVMEVKSDGKFNEAMKQFRRITREKFVADRGIASENLHLVLDEMSLMSYMLIMLGSQEQMDEKCERAYYKLINGRHDAMSFLVYLQKASIMDFFEHFANIYKGSGMEQLKAHTLIEFLVGVQVVYNGKVNPKQLLHFPEIGEKKFQVALNGFGMYKGVGADTHVLRMISYLVDMLRSEAGKKQLSDAEMERLAKKIASKISFSSGLDFNDNVGELAQQYTRGKEAAKTWATNVYSKLAELNEDFNKIKDKYVK